MLNEEMRQRAIRQSEASIGFLRNELDATNVMEIREAINRLMEGQIRQRMLANVTQEYAFRVVDRALVPDFTDKVRPKKAIMMLVGGMLGAMLGIAIVLLRDFMRAPRRSPG
jgi:LPS O-antigen subunit length determinant protein (WzzB/FepE family)